MVGLSCAQYFNVVFHCVILAVSLWSELCWSTNILSVQSPRLPRQAEDEVDSTKRSADEHLPCLLFS